MSLWAVFRFISPLSLDMNKYTLLLLPFLFITLSLSAQQSYHYELEVKGVKAPTTVLFGYWKVGQAYLLDSVKVDSAHQTAQFKGTRALPTGVYFFTAGNKIPLEFIINGEYEMAFSTDISAGLDSFSVRKSVENEPFFAWRKEKIAQDQRIEMMKSMLNMLQRATRDRDVLDKQANDIRAAREAADALTRKQQLLYPKLFFPLVIKATTPPEVPPFIQPMNSDGTLNQGYMQYFRAHFWDNYTLDDDRLLNASVLAQKTDDWMQVLPANLDSVKAHLDVLLKKATVNKSTKQALLRLILARFDEPSYGGNETMLVYLFDQHVPTATAAGIDTAVWMRIDYKVNAYRPTLPGRIAPELKLTDKNGTLTSLYDFKAKYTLLYFFSPLCGHCQEVTPQIYEASLPYAEKGVRVFAVTTEIPEDIWKSYLAEKVPEWTCVLETEKPSQVEKIYATHTLPNVILLDENKKILIRRLPVSEIPKVLENIAGQ